VDLLVLRHPGALFRSFHPGESTLTLEAALKSTPLHVLGKAPDWVYLGLGTADLLQPLQQPGAMLENLDSLIQLILQKTRAQLVFTPAFEAFFSDESQREKARAYNAGLPALARDRAYFLNLNAKVNAFLEKHRLGSGDKRALHELPLKLTSMGRVFLSHAAQESLPQENL
jgi:lysophospholipase L1-like esterase